MYYCEGCWKEHGNLNPVHPVMVLKDQKVVHERNRDGHPSRVRRRKWNRLATAVAFRRAGAVYGSEESNDRRALYWTSRNPRRLPTRLCERLKMWSTKWAVHSQPCRDKPEAAGFDRAN